MIVRQHKQEVSRKYLYNIAGVGLLAIIAVFALKQSFMKDDTPLCEARYSGGVLFSLARRGGEPLAATDLQARLGGSDWGIGPPQLATFDGAGRLRGTAHDPGGDARRRERVLASPAQLAETAQRIRSHLPK